MSIGCPTRYPGAAGPIDPAAEATCGTAFVVDVPQTITFGAEEVLRRGAARAR